MSETVYESEAKAATDEKLREEEDDNNLPHGTPSWHPSRAAHHAEVPVLNSKATWFGINKSSQQLCFQNNKTKKTHPPQAAGRDEDEGDVAGEGELVQELEPEDESFAASAQVRSYPNTSSEQGSVDRSVGCEPNS